MAPAPRENTRAPAASEPACLAHTLAPYRPFDPSPIRWFTLALDKPRNGGCRSRLGRYLESLRERRVEPQPTPLGYRRRRRPQPPPLLFDERYRRQGFPSLRNPGLFKPKASLADGGGCPRRLVLWSLVTRSHNFVKVGVG